MARTTLETEQPRRFGYIFPLQTAEVSPPNHLGGDGINRHRTIQLLMQFKHAGVGRGFDQFFTQGDLDLTAAAMTSLSGARLVDQNAAHV